ncbi:hypothetical protein BGC07_18000 [Piscirickettsia litoralis]|uniref:Gp5/Type VI secretion system Vgr protein OB-fold domain-containing protein n=1 Tax=Piscirickettsia litoralis TaxID=1891921 RepID=A0ABX2ZYT2_9GAMM|nr:hypothetical protein BGC07_18000 [Piscirickettsia litoralis]
MDNPIEIQLKQLSYQINDLRRRLYQLCRIGNVVELDAKNARAKVKFIQDNSVLISEWMRWKPLRANKNTIWWTPQIDEQVEVIAPFGEPSQAYISGSFYSQSFVPPDNSEKHFTIAFEDGAQLQYDTEKSKLSIKTTGDINLNCKNYSLTSSGDVSVQSTGSISNTATENLNLNGKQINIG